MRHYILTGHARISEGLASAAELILGRKVKFYNAYVSEEAFFLDEIRKEIADCPPEDDVIIMTDVLGGSVNNEMMQFLKYGNVHLICGTNLPLVIGMLMMDETKETSEMVKECISEAKEGICYCNMWEEQEAGSLDDF